VSTSRDNLRAVEAPTEEPILPPLLDKRTKETVTDLRWLLALGFGSVAAVVVASVSTVAFAQDAGAKAAAPVEAHVVKTDAEVAALNAKVAEQDRRMANVERMTVETNATLRLVAMRLGVTPVTLEQPKDGGP